MSASESTSRPKRRIARPYVIVPAIVLAVTLIGIRIARDDLVASLKADPILGDHRAYIPTGPVQRRPCADCGDLRRVGRNYKPTTPATDIETIYRDWNRTAKKQGWSVNVGCNEGVLTGLGGEKDLDGSARFFIIGYRDNVVDVWLSSAGKPQANFPGARVVPTPELETFRRTGIMKCGTREYRLE
jgi:hypothetical protein